MALTAHAVVPLAGFQYRWERASTPGMQICRHAADALGMPEVPGKFLAQVDWLVLCCPVQLDQVTLNPEDYRYYAAVTRAFSMSACRGDRDFEARLWKMRAFHGPWTSHAVPLGVLWLTYLTTMSPTS